MRNRSKTGGVSLPGKCGLTIFYIAMVAMFSFASPSIFFTVATFQNIGQSNCVIAIVAIGSLLPLVVGEYDLTVGAVVGLAAISYAKLSIAGVPFLIAFLLTCAIGFVIGLVNSFAVNVLHVSSLIATLGAGSIISGFTAYLTGGRTVTEGISNSLISFAQRTWLGVPKLIYVVIALAIVIWFLLGQTPLGRELYAVGMNRESARLMGARVQRDITIGFCISGVLAAAAGVIQLGVLQAAQPNIGSTLLLPALAVAFLGASTIRPGWFNVWGTLIGVLVVQTGVVGLADIGAPYWIEPIFDGAVLVIAVAVSTFAFAPMRARVLQIFRRQN
jgi:ribose transport system permease protein